LNHEVFELWPITSGELLVDMVWLATEPVTSAPSM